MDNPSSFHSITAVIVTYGNRKCFLEPVLKSVLTQQVHSILIINNGGRWDIEALAASLSPIVQVIHLPTNTGSAGGFSAGIQKALELQSQLIWLLDDDTCPSTQTLDQLFKAYLDLSSKHQPENLAVVCFRPTRFSPWVYSHPNRLFRNPFSFMGFDITQIPSRLWTRITRIFSHDPLILPDKIPLETAPYSGLLFHSTLIKHIGLPCQDFVVYVDDSEFTYRITQTGGVLYLITHSVLKDIGPIWHHGISTHQFFVALQGQDDFRAYYNMRNEVYFDLHIRKHAPQWLYHINQILFFGILFMFSILYGKQKRYRILVRAIQDGQTQRLGIHPNYPLS